jgi:hypothetical protein
MLREMKFELYQSANFKKTKIRKIKDLEKTIIEGIVIQLFFGCFSVVVQL